MDERFKKTQLHYSEELHQTADSIEAYSKSHFVCATYQLLDKPKDSDNLPVERIGSLMLYKVHDNEKECIVEKIQHIDSNAVLDMKWHRTSSNAILTVADSKGEAHFYGMINEKLQHQHCLVIDSSTLCLSADWCKTTYPQNVAYSLSSGDLCMVQLTESQPSVLQRWKGHTLEAWIIAADCTNEKLFYSGADDCRLKLWDLRMGVDRACFVSKYHEMGVCSIQCNPFREHVFCSGSYDESIVTWDNRYMKTPICEIPTGGGVWRLKWHPECSTILLAACMHNGYKIFEYSDTLLSAECIYSYTEHVSLAYGVDWCLDAQPTTTTSKQNSSLKCGTKIASCSFYDKLLTVWSV